VAVLVELKARFDEESNIEWARALEREGVHVVYGLLGLKVHCKIALIVRREQDGIRRYLHLGTGNYNATTARLYTDLTLFTCHPDLGADATDLFNYLTGYSHKSDFRRLLVAPVTLRERMTALIRREIEHGSRGRLIFKMNALEDRAMVKLFYEASRAGVRVDLIVAAMLPASGNSRSQRKHSRDQRCRAVSRTQPVVLLRERRRRRDVYGQRGSDAAQPRPARGDSVPDPEPADRPAVADGVLDKCLADNRKSRIGRPDGFMIFCPSMERGRWIARLGSSGIARKLPISIRYRSFQSRLP